MSTSTPTSSRNPLPHVPIYTVDFKGDFKEIGRGGESRVYKIRHGQFGTVAYKQYYKSAEISLNNEVRNLIKSPHPNIVQVFGLVRDVRSEQYISGYIMEYMGLGSLHSYIHNDENKYGREQIWSWVEQAGLGLDYLHGKRILHRDIKPHNMLLGPTADKLKLSDFGVSREFQDSRSLTNHTKTGGRGTWFYMAPEMISHTAETETSVGYSQPADVYAFAISVWEMFSRKEPYFEIHKEVSVYDLVTKILGGQRPSCLDEKLEVEKEMRALVKRGWSREPKERPRIGEFIELAERLRNAADPSRDGSRHNPKEGPIRVVEVVPNLTALTFDEPHPEELRIFPIIDRLMEKTILFRYFSQLPEENVPKVRKELQKFGEICHQREKTPEEGDVRQELSILILGPLAEENSVRLEQFIRKQKVEDGFLLFEVSVAAGDVFVFTYRPRKDPKKGLVQVDRDNRLSLRYSPSLPILPPLLLYPSVPVESQLLPGEEVNILFAGDARTNAENFLKKAVVSFIRKELQRNTGSRGDELPYTVALAGRRFRFHATEKGSRSLVERLEAEEKKLRRVAVVCLMVDLDAKKEPGVVEAINSIGKTILVGYAESMEQITQRSTDFYGQVPDVVELKDNLLQMKTNQKEDPVKTRAKVKVIQACLAATIGT